MAGLQVRAYEMARALGRRGHDVTIAAPPPLPPHEAIVRLRYMDIEELNHTSRFDLWIAAPLVARRHLARFSKVPFVMDGYEAPFASFLAHGAALLPTLGERVMHDYRNTILEYMRALEHADLVLSANESQRICYLSLLCLLGKINPKYAAQNMVTILQSGAPPELPKRNPTNMGKVGPVVLWAGGAYPWFDLDTYVAALPTIVSAVPDVGFVFAGLGGRDQVRDEPLGFPAASRIFESVQRSDAVRIRSRFVAWQSYADRGALYTGADIGVSTYKQQLETTFSMRTRTIDMVWGGLPIIVSEGDSLSASLQARGAGIAVPAESPQALADAIIGLLRDPERRRLMAASARSLAAGDWSWDSQIDSLHTFCVSPHFEPGRDDSIVRRTTRGMIRLADGIEWHVRDRGWRAWWRLMRLLSRRSNRGIRGGHSEGVVRRP